MTHRIIFFEGDGLIGQAIGALTGSDMSHVAWQTPDGTLWEAVDDGFKATPLTGEDWLEPLRKYHPKGKKVHVFNLDLDAANTANVYSFLTAIKDQPYGFRTLFTFMCHPGKDPEQGKVICSEAVLGASIAGNRPLLVRLAPWNCSPRDLFISPELPDYSWAGSYTL